MQKRTIQVFSILLLLGLFLWGGSMLMVYLGVPVHGAVLVDNETKKVLSQQECSSTVGMLFSCGLKTIAPMITFGFTRAMPFLSYIFLSLFFYAVFLIWNFIRTGKIDVFRVRIAPFAYFLGFIFSVWLLFSFLSVSETSRISMRQIAEPSPLVYADASPEVIKSLKGNFDDLMERGCLKEIGQYESGAKVYNMSIGCMQGSFFMRVIPPFLFLLVLLFELLTAGRMILRLFRISHIPAFVEAVISAGLGACAWILILWLLAVFHLIVGWAVWTVAILLPLLGYRQSLYWLKHFVRRGEEQEISWSSVSTVLVWLLITYLALNFLTVVRPFPIGWDDLGSYLNRPRLMVSYGSFIFSMAPFQWEYLTSLGFVLFGYESVFGATASMMVNWLAGALATGTVIAFGRSFLGRGRGLLAALLFYTLPLIGHFSFADMKIDNAIFTMGALGTLALFLALFPIEEDEGAEHPPHSKLQWLALSGIFLGFGFAMKPTTVMVLMALSGVLLGVSLSWAGFAGVVFFAFAVFVKQGVLDITDVLRRIGGLSLINSQWVFVSFIVLGAAFVAAAFLIKRSAAKRTMISLLVFGFAFLGSIFPWIYHNDFLAGQIIPTRLEFGAPNPYNPLFDINGKTGSMPGRPYRSLPADLRVDANAPACVSTGGREELDRYWGTSTGWSHYLTLPWRTILNLDSYGYYVTTSPALFLFPLLLLLPFFWMRRGRWLRWLLLATGFIILEWMFLANGIPWYGIGMFLGLVIGIEALLIRAPDLLSRSVTGILIALALVTAFSNRLWQYEVTRNLLEYPFGKISAKTLQDRTVPYYDTIARILVERNRSMPNRPYVYRVGTFIPYFIPKNLEIIGMSDHQLDFFNCLYAERDPELTLRRFKSLGFNSIIFDTNTATIEKDAQGSLHQKVNEFLGFLNTRSMGLQPVTDDLAAGIVFVLIP